MDESLTDWLLVEVTADETPAVLAVLNADKKRLDLLAREAALIKESEAGNADAGTKLKEVRGGGVKLKLLRRVA